MKQTDDLRIAATKELVSPAQIHEQLPLSEAAAECTAKARQEIQAIMAGADDRMVVVVGPCSIHDPKSAIEYANDDDIVLVAGKGHETYQEIEGVQHPFSDLEEVRRLIA